MQVLKQEQLDKKSHGFVITRWMDIISDSDGDVFIDVDRPAEFTQAFQLLDDDGNIYFLGWQDPKNFNEFNPLDFYGQQYGCVSLEYYKDGELHVL